MILHSRARLERSTVEGFDLRKTQARSLVNRTALRSEAFLGKELPSPLLGFSNDLRAKLKTGRKVCEALNLRYDIRYDAIHRLRWW